MIQGYENIPEVSTSANSSLQKVFENAMPVLKNVLTVVPTTTDLPDGWKGFYEKDGERRIYYNINGTIEVEFLTVSDTLQYLGTDASGNKGYFDLPTYEEFPQYGVVMWPKTIATIPSGWIIYDGNNGTTNWLGDKFLKTVTNGSTNPGSSGGASTHAHGVGSYSVGNHSHSVTIADQGWGKYYGGAFTNFGIADRSSGTDRIQERSFTTSSNGAAGIGGTSASANHTPPWVDWVPIGKT